MKKSDATYKSHVAELINEKGVPKDAFFNVCDRGLCEHDQGTAYMICTRVSVMILKSIRPSPLTSIGI